ncbi:MAG: ABC transporter permease [Propionibacteriaceae bacterium]|nr:ABC transporter permease [Propionibacteriaceae bacterium]
MASTWVLVSVSFGLALYTTATSVRAGLFFIDIVNSELNRDLGINDLSSSMIGAPIYSGVLLTLLGILSITNEYSSGMIRTTLTVTPSRWPALAAKAIVVATFAFVTSAIAELLGAILSFPGLPDTVRFDLFLPSGLRVWLGSAFVLALMAMLGLGLGTLIRSTAVAVVAYFGVMLVLPLLFLLGTVVVQPDNKISNWILLHLPAVAPIGIYTPVFDNAAPFLDWPATTASTTIATLIWTLLPVGFGFWSLLKRDA